MGKGRGVVRARDVVREICSLITVDHLFNLPKRHRLYSSQSTLICVFAAIMAADTNLFDCILQVYRVHGRLNYKLLMKNITGEKQRKDFI